MGTKNRSTAAGLMMGSLQMLILFILPLLVLAQQPGQTPPSNNPSDTDPMRDGRSISLTWERIVAGFVLLLVGIILTFRGYRHYRFTMFLAGFIAGCAIVYSILTNTEPDQGWNHSQIIYVFGCLGGGLIIGSICALFTPFLVFILGGVAGLAVGLYVLAWRNQGLIRVKGGRIGLLVGAPVAGIIIALLIGRKILIPASAIVGAYITVTGVDLFARTGFTESIQKFFTTDSKVDYRLNTNMYIMLGVLGGLILLGMTFQFLSWRHRRQALIAQGRSSHEYDHDWTIFGWTRPVIRPDPTYPNGHYTGYNGNYGSSGYNTGPSGYNPGYNNDIHSTTGNNNDHVQETYTEKKSWNPFKGKKPATSPSIASAPQPTATLNTSYPDDNRVSYSSQAALNQNQ